MELLIFLGGAMFGGCLGIGFMCCLQINRINEEKRKIEVIREAFKCQLTFSY